MRLLRGVSGAVAAGVVVLTLVVLGTAVLAGRRGFPGPGGESLAWHIGLAVVVVAAQVFADRKRGFAAFGGALVVFAAAGWLLWSQWWG